MICARGGEAIAAIGFALGGFVTARNGEVLAFSLIYNGSDRWAAKAAMNQIGASMAEFVRQ